MQSAMLRGSAFSSRVAVAPMRRPQAFGLAPRPQQLVAPAFTGGHFSGSILAPARPQGRGALVVVAGGKSMGCTLQGTKRARRRTSGFRTRMASTNGRNVLAARRKKGRHNLCPASQGKSGGKK